MFITFIAVEYKGSFIVGDDGNLSMVIIIMQLIAVQNMETQCSSKRLLQITLRKDTFRSAGIQHALVD